MKPLSVIETLKDLTNVKDVSAAGKLPSAAAICWCHSARDVAEFASAVAGTGIYAPALVDLHTESLG